jgi:hypothetical protein
LIDNVKDNTEQLEEFDNDEEFNMYGSKQPLHTDSFILHMFRNKEAFGLDKDEYTFDRR